MTPNPTDSWLQSRAQLLSITQPLPNQLIKRLKLCFDARAFSIFLDEPIYCEVPLHNFLNREHPFISHRPHYLDRFAISASAAI
ncbi:MAG: hypothetical protein ACI85S_002907 [Pseudohongiellaceae bacterium]|jgi:hypothetical protein